MNMQNYYIFQLLESNIVQERYYDPVLQDSL